MTALFNLSTNENNATINEKEDAILEIVDDYNKMFGESFNRKSDPQLKDFTTDVTMRLSHKGSLKNMTPDQMLDIVIVVDMLLTGFDSKYVNTLYMDKVLETDNLIQAISRTNRVFNQEDKPFGLFRYYRKPYTMQRNIEDALRLYCEGGNTSGAIVASIDENLDNANRIYTEIKNIFENDDVINFIQLPVNDSTRQKFKKLFIELKQAINSMKLQGMCWASETDEYVQKLLVCEKWIDGHLRIYDILTSRYNDACGPRNNTTLSAGKLSYNIKASLSEVEQNKINAYYLETHFRKIIPVLTGNFEENEKNKIISDFSIQLAILPVAQQEYAHMIINDIKDGKLIVKNQTLRELIAEYKTDAKVKEIVDFAQKYGLNEQKMFDVCKDYNPNNNKLNMWISDILLKNYDVEKAQAALNTDKRLITNAKLNKEIKQFVENISIKYL